MTINIVFRSFTEITERTGAGTSVPRVTCRLYTPLHYQGRKLSTATTATAVDALQLAEVPLKIDPYSRPKWPVPSHPPGRGAPLGSSEKLSS